VIDVIVRYEDPPNVLRFNEGEHVFQPLLAICGTARVDDHRLFAENDHRIYVDEQRLSQCFLYLTNHEGVLRDSSRRHTERGRNWCVGHVGPPRANVSIFYSVRVANGSTKFLPYEKERARLSLTGRGAKMGRRASHACHTDT